MSEELIISISPKEILCLEYFNNRDMNEPISQWKQSEFGSDYKKTLQYLFEEGYLRKSNLEENISYKIIPDLKEILKTKNLKISGKKADLIARIFNNFSEEELQKYCTSCRYILTDYGKKALSQNEIYILNDKHANFPISQIYQYKTKFKELNPDITDKEILFKIIQQSTINSITSRNWNEVRTALLREAEYSQFLGYSQNALRCSLQITALDLSGCQNEDRIDAYKDLFIAPGIIRIIENSAILSNNINNQFDEFSIKAIHEITKVLPFSYFTDYSILKIIKEALLGKEFNPKNIKADFKRTTKNKKSTNSKPPISIQKKLSTPKTHSSGCLLPILSFLIIIFFLYSI